jgi:hypothetical protein
VRRVSVDVEASHLGHDLSRGVAGFRRVWETTGKTAEEAAVAENGAGHSDGDGSADGEALVPALASGPVPVPASGWADGSAGDPGNGSAGDPADEDIFDDGAIETLAEDSGTVATPS